MKIALVIYQLDCGGSERIISSLANFLVNREHAVSLHPTLPGPTFFALDKRVKLKTTGGITPLNSNILRRAIHFFKRFLLIRKSILEESPDVVLSFLNETNVRTLVSLLGTRIPVIVSERTYPPMHRIHPVYSTMRRILYPFAKVVVVQTSPAQEWAAGWLNPDKVRVIPNPARKLNDDKVSLSEVALPEGRIIVAMGRLSPEKGFDLLIDAFSLAAGRHPDWHLLILGDGVSRNDLEAKAQQSEFRDRITIPGAVKNPGPILKSCDLYALSSHFEGFPNALCEAMACGVPAVSFNCTAGPADIIRDGIDGVLVPPGDVRAFADALDRLMGDDSERARLAEKAVEITDRLDFDRIMKEWESLLAETADLLNE